MTPFLLLVGLLIRIRCGKPVLFCQQRVGKMGKSFTLLKLRTMTVAKNTEKGSFEPGDQSRVTVWGRWLRKYKIDELPQLWNVFKGDMSLVGPRPEIRRWVNEYPEKWAVVHQVRPGITDPASIIFRNEEEILAEAEDPEEAYRNNILPEKLNMYMEYVRHHSLSKDLKIIFKTLGVLAKNR